MIFKTLARWPSISGERNRALRLEHGEVAFAVTGRAQHLDRTYGGQRGLSPGLPDVSAAMLTAAPDYAAAAASQVTHAKTRSA